MFKIEEEKDREKEKVRQQAGEPQREKQLQPRTKPIEFHYKNTYFFHSPWQKCLLSQIKRPFPAIFIGLLGARERNHGV